jgi:hypothetical protein
LGRTVPWPIQYLRAADRDTPPRIVGAPHSI